MTTILLLRHGATEANETHPPRLQGRRENPPLSPLGRRQAEGVRDLLRGTPLVACYSSPLLRAAETAAVVAAPHGLEVRTVEALTECDVGVWAGLDWGTIQARYPEAHRAFLADPGRNPYLGGESYDDVRRRVFPALREIVERHSAGPVLVACHQVVIRAILAEVMGIDDSVVRKRPIPNGGILEVHHDPRWRCTGEIRGLELDPAENRAVLGTR